VLVGNPGTFASTLNGLSWGLRNDPRVTASLSFDVNTASNFPVNSSLSFLEPPVGNRVPLVADGMSPAAM